MITGGSGYLGEEMGSHLIKCGYFVINLGRKKPNFCDNSKTSAHFSVDFYKSELLEIQLKIIIKKYTKIDILINNSFDFSKKTGFNSEKGRIEKMNQKLLIELKQNQKGIITGVKRGTASLLSYLDRENIKLGDAVKVLEIIEFDGTFIVEINKRKLTFSEKICQNLLLETYD